MTDRVQPGAIDSIVRNDEVSQIFGQFSEGWIVESGTTAAARRRSNIDETALNSFSFVSSSGLNVTIDAGEAFVGGWCARDTQTTLQMPANDTATVVVGWGLDAVFDPVVDANRDVADETIVQIERNTDPDYPVTPIFEIQTNSSSVTSTTDVRNLGPTAVVDLLDADSVDAASAAVDDLTAISTFTDAAGVAHSGELADNNKPVTDFPVGTVADGDFVRNENGSLVGEARVRNISAIGSVPSQQFAVANTSTQLDIDNTLLEQDASVIEVDTTNSRLTIKESGVYHITGNIGIRDDVDSVFILQKNGSQTIAGSDSRAGNTFGNTHSIGTIIEITSPPAQITGRLTSGSPTKEDIQAERTTVAVSRQS